MEQVISILISTAYGLSGMIAIAAYIPQIVKMYKNKSSENVY